MAVVGVCTVAVGSNVSLLAYIYTEAPRYNPGTGNERFPAGARLIIVSNGSGRVLVPSFSASADAAVSLDGKRVLFSGEEKANAPWQIFEIPAAGGTPRQITSGNDDCLRPFYLPDEKIVYARRTPQGFQLEIVPLAGGAPLRLTYSPGDHFATDVLRDGRVLFEAPYPAPPSAIREVYTVYVDGSGVEAHRCDHGRDRHAGRELLSGDIVFETAGRLARFTSARAAGIEIPLPKGEFAGPVAEIEPGEWLVSYRAKPGAAFALYRLDLSQNRLTPLRHGHGNALQPVLIQPHRVPLRHPSGLGNRVGANLLCLNAYTSRTARIAEGSVAAVRLYTLDDAGAQVQLGEAPVERDGSFFVTAPSERPLRFELVDANANVVQAEQGWFWARRGEQRICVGCHAGAERTPENAVPEVLLRSTDPVKMLLPVHSAHGGLK